MTREAAGRSLFGMLFNHTSPFSKTMRANAAVFLKRILAILVFSLLVTALLALIQLALYLQSATAPWLSAVSIVALALGLLTTVLVLRFQMRRRNLISESFIAMVDRLLEARSRQHDVVASFENLSKQLEVSRYEMTELAKQELSAPYKTLEQAIEQIAGYQKRYDYVADLLSRISEQTTWISQYWSRKGSERVLERKEYLQALLSVADLADSARRSHAGFTDNLNDAITALRDVKQQMVSTDILHRKSLGIGVDYLEQLEKIRSDFRKTLELMIAIEQLRDQIVAFEFLESKLRNRDKQ